MIFHGICKLIVLKKTQKVHKSNKGETSIKYISEPRGPDFFPRKLETSGKGMLILGF